MISVNAVLKFIDSGSSQVGEAITDNIKNNISTNMQDVVEIDNIYRKPFILGKSKLNEGCIFSSGEKYFIGKQISGTNGIFKEPYIIRISGTNLNTFSISFAYNEYPEEIYVNNVRYENSSNKFTVTNLVQTRNIIEVAIYKMPKAHQQLIILGIYCGITLDIAYDMLSNIETNMSDRASNEEPSFGIISNGGNLEFKDSYSKVKEYSSLLFFKNKITIDIYLNESSTNMKSLLCRYKVVDWEYNTDNKYVTAEIKDILEELQDLSFAGIKMVANGNKTGEDMYIDLYNATPSKFNFIEFSNLDEKTQSALKSIVFEKYYMLSDNLWKSWDKLAQLAMAHIFQDFNGNTLFKVE